MDFAFGVVPLERTCDVAAPVLVDGGPLGVIALAAVPDEANERQVGQLCIGAGQRGADGARPRARPLRRTVSRPTAQPLNRREDEARRADLPVGARASQIERRFEPQFDRREKLPWTGSFFADVTSLVRSLIRSPDDC